MSEPKDMIVPMLREMRQVLRTSFERVEQQFDAVNARLDRIEAAQGSFRAALTADTLMARLVTGEFEQRIADLERRTQDLMGGR